MIILAHRGWWVSADEQNTRMSFERALSNGFGIETDIRDLNGRLVISHDMPVEPKVALTVDDFFGIYRDIGGGQMLALNIKSDGMSAPLLEKLRRYGITNYFVFDMSIPDALSYVRAEIAVFTRRSEFEPPSRLERFAQGLWLDAFEDHFVSESAIRGCLSEGKFAAIVSPELHRRSHVEAWCSWRMLFDEIDESWRQKIALCTDFPDLAHETFNDSTLKNRGREN
jgi:hypothetical protein